MSGEGTEGRRRPESAVGDAQGSGGGAPSIRRRSVLGGAALGITTSVLPAATAAASGPTPDGSSAPSYATGSGPLLSWEPFDTTGINISGSNADEGWGGSNGGVSGLHRRFGGDDRTSTVTAIDGDESALSAWSMSNAGALEALSTSGEEVDDITRGIRWQLTNDSEQTVEVASLVLYRVRNAGATSGPLRLAFYSNGLRRTVELAHDVTRHIVIPLGAQSVAAGATLAVTAFPYATATTRELQLIRYDSTTGNEGGALVPLDPVADAIQTDVIGKADTSSNERAYTAAFIGRVLSP